MAAFALARGGYDSRRSLFFYSGCVPFYIDFAMAFMEDGPDVPFIHLLALGKPGGKVEE
jgi:hypothetical protein